MKGFILPKKIITYKNVLGVENLKKDKPMQIGFNEEYLTVIQEGGYVILDFGKELCGSLRVLARSCTGNKKLRIVYGESVAETMSQIGVKGATNDHIVRDCEYFIPNWSDTTFTNSGFRFVMIQSVGDATVEIKHAVVVPTIYSKPFKGKFISDDKLVNKIFSTAAYTLRLCIQNNVIWDGIKRDRLVWIGDMNPETLSANCLFGSLKEVENTLTFAKDQSPLPLWMNNFPTYSLWWIVCLRDYYFQNKNHEYLLAQKDYLKGLAKQLLDYVDEQGRTLYGFNFIDWPTHYTEGDLDEQKRLDEITGTHALTVYAVKCARQLLEILQEDLSSVDELLARLLKTKYKVEKFKQISALKLVAGIGDKEDVEVIVNGGAKGMSTFMSYFILKGATDGGYEYESVEMMKDYYGKMLSLGATSFWEDFDISWAENAGRIDKLPKKGKKDVHGDFGAFCYKGFRHSFCHGWSSGVVAFLMNVVAGIEIVKPGCEEIRIVPKLGTLNHVKVEYPTPYGILQVEHVKRLDGSVATTVQAPKGVKIVK